MRARGFPPTGGGQPSTPCYPQRLRRFGRPAEPSFLAQEREEELRTSPNGDGVKPVKRGQALSTPKTWRHRCQQHHWGALNVRTLACQISVGNNGDLSFRGTDVDKPDVLCELLHSHGISLCCISEHRWKGEGTIVCGDYLYVFSGLPETAPKAMQGVAACMNAEMQRAWRAAGQFCRYEGGRLLHVKLLLHGRVVNVVAVYAPTFNTEAAEKDAFYDKLREILDTVRSGEEVFVMGDFNARVGTTTHSALSGSATVHASDAIGPFGLGHLNDNGERLLSLCEGSPTGLLKVAGTFFRHKHYGTWMRKPSDGIISIMSLHQFVPCGL